MSKVVAVGYTGTPLPTGSNVEILFCTVCAGWGKNALQMHGLEKLVLSLSCSQNGAVTAYKSSDHGVNWRQIQTANVTAASDFLADWVVTEYPDFRLTWTNGGVDQTYFDPSIALTTNRAVSS